MREALGLAFDFEWMNRQMMYNSYIRVRGFFNNSDFEAKGLPGPDELKVLEPLKKNLPEKVFAQEVPLPPSTNPPDSLRDNLRKARDLLAAAGWTYRDGALRNAKGEAFTVEYLDSGGGERLIAPYFQALGRLGIEGEYRRADFALIQKRLDVFDFDLFTVRIPGREAPGARAARPLRLAVGGHRRLQQLDGDTRPGDRRARQPGGLVEDPARARGAPAGARPRVAPRPLRGAAILLQQLPGLVSFREVRAAQSPAAVLPGGRLGDLDLVEEAVKMWSYVLQRLLLMIPTLFGILLITFIVIQFVPGGPVEQMVAQLQGREGGIEGGGAPSGPAAPGAGGYRGRQGVDAKHVEEIKKLYGFDKPAHERFFKMVWQFARFDLGRSFFQNKDVWQLIKEKLPVSISLGLWTFLLIYLISVPLGIAKAVRAGTPFDTGTTFLVLLGYSIPSFVLGVVLLVYFAGGTFVQWFPLRNIVSTNWDSLSLAGKIADYFWHITLPVTAMVVGGFAVITILTKNSVLEEIRKHYVLTARAKGVDERRVLWRHVFRNALIPIMTGFPAAFVGAFFTGSLLIETLFSLDGLGLLSYEAVIRRDYPVVFGSLFVFTIIGLLTHLIRDLSYVWVDPRVKYFD